MTKITKFEFVSVIALITLLYLSYCGQPEMSEILQLDGGVYSSMSKKIVEESKFAGPPPWAFRVGTPILVAHFFPDNFISGYRAVNFVFGFLFYIVLYCVIRSRVSSVPLSILLLTIAATTMFGVLRFTYFSPVYVDPTALFFITLIVYLTLILDHKYTFKVGAIIALIAAIGVCFREIVLLGAAIGLFSNQVVRINEKKIFPWIFVDWRQCLIRLFPIVVAALVFIYIRSIVDYSSYPPHSFISQAKGTFLYILQHPLYFFAALVTGIGPIVVIPLLFFKNLPHLSKEMQIIYAYLIFVLCLSVMGGHHTERFLNWGIVGLLPLVGRLVESEVVAPRPLLYKLALFFSILIFQICSQHVFNYFPDFDFSSINVDTSKVDYVLFSAYGREITGAYLSSFTMGPELRTLLSEQLLALLFVLSLFKYIYFFVQNKSKKK